MYQAKQKKKKNSGCPITTSIFVTEKKAESENVSNWYEEIKELMIQFCVPEPIRNAILQSVSSNAKPTDSQEILYARAWSKFKAVIKA